ARPFGRENVAGLCTRSSAGLGADVSVDRATGAGLLSALAHVRLLDVLHGRAPVHEVDLTPPLDDRLLTFLTRSAAGLGVPVELLELGAGDGLPVLLARCAVDSDAGDSDAGGLWTLAADTSWRA